MERILNKCESTYVASWFPDVNFNDIEELYTGSYNPTIERTDNYEILINFDLDFLSSRLYSIEKAILKLFYVKKSENVSEVNNNDKVMIYMNTQEFDVSSVTWNNKPAHLEQGIKFSIGNTVDNREIEIDITDVIRRWLYGQQEKCGITIVLPTNAGQSLIYFAKDVSLQLQYTPVAGVFGYFQNDNISSLNSGDVIYPGTVYEGDNVQIVKSRDNQPVIQCLLPGMYEISCIGNTTSNNDFGNLSFKIGNKNQSVSQFRKVNNKPFIGGRQLTSEALFYVNSNWNQVALVSESNMGSSVQGEFYTSTIIQRKKIGDNIILYPSNGNIFTGGNLGNLQITLNVDSTSRNMVFGVDDLTIFSGDLYVQGDFGNENRIIFRNIKINGTLDLSAINGTIVLENVDATNLNITSQNTNNVEVGTGCSFINVNIQSQGQTYFKIIDNAKEVAIQNVYLSPKGIFNNRVIVLKGSFGSANIEIRTALRLQSKGITVSGPIIVNIIEGNSFNVELSGDFSTNIIKIISQCTIIFIPNLNREFISRTNNALGVQIIVDPNTLDNVVQFQGDLKGATINVVSLASIKIDTDSNIALLNISDTCTQAVVSLASNITIDNFKTGSPVVLSGDIDSIKQALAIAIITKSTGNIDLDLGENPNDDLVDILNVSTKLQMIFIPEITANILYEYIQSIANQVDSNVIVTIRNITNLVQNSGAFTLNNVSQSIDFKEQVANKDSIDLNKAILSIDLSKGSENLQKNFLLKGKYEDMTINYESQSCIVDGNTLNLMEYVVQDKNISTVQFNNDMNFWGYNLKIANRNLVMNLNNHYLNLDSMWLQDGEINIENGVINVQNNMDNWGNYANVLSFITVVKDSLYTSVNLNSMIIKASNIIAGVNMNSSIKATLISTINNKSNLNNNVDILNLYNCTLQVDKNDAHTNNNIDVYGINTSSISNMMDGCTLIGMFNGIRIQNNVSSIFMKNAFSQNNFQNNSSKGFRVIEAIPYKGCNGVVNGTNVNSNATEDEVLANLYAMCNALIETRGYLKANIFNEGSLATLVNDESRIIIKELVYENGKWVESQGGGLDAPVINPDTTNNDMMNNIVLTFIPNNQWASNIQQISVKNSKNTVLTPDKYSIDNNKGEITIFNVKVNENDIPIYQGILEPSNNIISVYSSNYKVAKVTQFIKSIQIVEMKNGEGKAITRIEGQGQKNLSGYVISGDNKYKIGKDKQINILPNNQ